MTIEDIAKTLVEYCNTGQEARGLDELYAPHAVSVEAMVPPDSDLIGREVTGVQLFKREGVRLVDVVRRDLSLRRNLSGVTLQVGDRVILRTEMTEL